VQSALPILQHGDVLSFEEMHRIARLAVSLGIEKIRITGGEPLVRKGLVDFLGKLSALSGLRELVLTTNGLLLREYAAELRSAGVHRINMSLDSLQPQTFSALTRGGDLNRALDGMAAAGEAGFPPVKINAVVIRGMNDGEYMPTNMAPDWPSAYVSGTEILERIGKVYPLEPQPEDETAGPAKIFKIPGSLGSIGVITPISSHFCDTCNRLRITASGVVKGCLFDHGTVSLKPYLERNDAELREFLLSAIRNKPDRHHLLDPEQLITPFSMAQIGG
jgi:cyclic pyranopterin phosphate synthase